MSMQLAVPVLKVAYRDVSQLKYSNDPKEDWHDLSPISPELDISVCDENGEDQIFVTLFNSTSDYLDQRSIDVTGKYISDGSMNVDLKGHGIGRLILRNYIELGVHCGLKEFHVRAASSNGGYTWAKAGIPMIDPIYGESLSLDVKDRLSPLQYSLLPHIYDEAMAAAEMKSKYDIFDIADLSYNLETVFSERNLRENSGKVWRAIYEFKESIGVVEDQLVSKTNDEVKRIRYIQRHCHLTGAEFTMGKYLLTQSSYQGLLMFDDGVAMSRIEEYVGGFKTIDLVDIDPSIKADSAYDLKAA